VKVLKLLYTSTKTPGTFTGSTRAYWSNGADAMFLHGLGVSVNVVDKMFLDGTAVTLGNFSSNGDSLDFDHAPETNDLLIQSALRAQWSPLDPISFLADIQKPFTTGITSTEADHGIFLRDRAGVMKYYERFARGYRRYDSLTASLEATVEVYPSGGNVDRDLMWVNDQTILVPVSNGDIYLWDVDTETLILQSTIEAPRLVTVDNVHQNLVSIRLSDGVVQVWKLEVEPATMSALSATPGTYTRYHTEELSVTVLGDDSEPAAGVTVEWTVEILGSESGAANAEEMNQGAINAGASSLPSKGKITPNASTTDSAGIARATYCPPGLDWLSGDEDTITAVVRT
jgi:hypothetical protein